MKRTKKKKANVRLRKRRLFYTKPRTKEELWLWVKMFFGIELTKNSVCPHHDSQLDYLWWLTQKMGDSFCLAARNTGKTQIEAIDITHASIFDSPCRTIMVAGCLHPSSPVITTRGFKPINEIRTGDMVYDGKNWNRAKGIAFRPPTNHLKFSFIGYPELYLTHNHPVLIIRGIECKLKDGKKISPRVCSSKVTCPYHTRRFKCRGHGKVEMVPASEVRIGDAMLFPTGYLSHTNNKKSNVDPFIQGLIFGSHTEIANGMLTFYKRRSISKEYDRYILDLIRDGIAKRLSVKPLRQEGAAARGFAIRYDKNFFKNYHLGIELPYDYFLWNKDDQKEFMRGAFSGTRFTTSSVPTYNKSFATTRNTRFALNVLSMIPLAKPKIDHWDKDTCTRLVFSNSCIEPIKNILPKKYASAKAYQVRSETTPEFNLTEWGKCLGVKIKAIEEQEPTVPFVDIEVENGEMFTTLWGVVHNSKLQASHAYRYTKKIFSASSDGIVNEDAESVGVEETVLKNGSSFRLLSSTNEAAGGFHVQRIKIDQIDDMSPDVYETLQFDIDQAATDHTQVDMVGTWDKLGGLYDVVLQRAREQNQKIFSWCLLDALEPCRDRMCSNCDLSDCCAGIAKSKPLEPGNGFLKIDKAIQVRKRLITQSKWDVQALLKKPRPLSAIIPKFNDAPPYVQTIGFNKVLDTRRGFDWGARGNFACVWLQYNEYEDRVYVVDELSGKPRQGAIDCAELVNAYEGRQGYRNILSSYGDPSGASWVADFSIMGIKVLTMYVPKDTRLDILTQLLEVRKDNKPGIIISAKCRKLRDQLLSYDARCYEKRSGAPRDDFVDALLYALGGMKNILKLRDNSVPALYTIKKSQEQARIEKFSPEMKRIVRLDKGKTDFKLLIP